MQPLAYNNMPADMSMIEFVVVAIFTVITTIAVAWKKNLQSKEASKTSSTAISTLEDVSQKIDTLVNEVGTIKNMVSKLDIWKNAWMELADHPIFICDDKGRLIWVNNEYLRFSGTTMQDIEGHGWFKIVHPDVRSNVKHEWDTCISNGTSFEMMLSIVNIQNKKERTVTCKSKPLINKDSRVVGYIGIFDLE